MLQEDLDKIHKWANKWLLDFNPNKCKAMQMRQGEKRPEGVYTINGRQLQETERERDLGVDIIPSLTPAPHTGWVASAAYVMLTNSRRSYRNMNHSVLKSIYSDFVRPTLEYAAPAWNAHCLKHETEKCGGLYQDQCQS
ncbi:uncharacterized protein [Procambarus clarkii]|uniref:uncharacterized protein n=1 Tax=Procambarus clarkii TaxID=6728 RepID=UPI0037446BAA